MSTPESPNLYPNPEHLLPGDRIEIRNPIGASYLFTGNVHTVIKSSPKSVTIYSKNNTEYPYEWSCEQNEKYHYFKYIDQEDIIGSILDQLDNLSEKIERELISNN